MKGSWGLFRSVVLAGFVVASFARGALPKANIDTTALALLLAADPLSDLSDSTVQKQLSGLKQETQFIFDEVLTRAGQQNFFLSPPVVFGMVILGLDEPTAQLLQGLPHTNGSIDLTKHRTGIAALDVLNAKFAATQLKVRYKSAYVTLNPALNPNRVALEYKNVPGVQYAQANHVGRMGGLIPVQRFGRHPSVYVFSVGWGDCPAGCIHTHRRYYEAFGTQRVAPLAVAGDPLEGEAASAAAYFIK